MNVQALKDRVRARDRLSLSAELASRELCQTALAALHRGDRAAAELAILDSGDSLGALVENLRIYQAELHAQAAELEDGRLRIELLMARFQALFINMPVASMLVDGAGVVLECNHRAAEVFQMGGLGAAPRFVQRLVSKADYQNRVRPGFQRATVDAVTSLDSIDFVAEDGRSFVGDMHIAALPLERGERPQYVCAVIDRSAHIEAARAKLARDSADMANSAKSAFLARMSHELRTPLNAILGFAQLMRLEAEAGDLVVKPKRVEFIETAARHLLDLINEVLDVSRIESGHMNVVLARVNLRALVAESLAMVVGIAEVDHITLVDHLADGPAVWVTADRLRLKEVLINLMSNAVKYNRTGGRVDVRVVHAGGRCDLCVSDSGKGMDAMQLKALFEPFNRVGAERTTVEGTGMGLFVSRRFAELMGASITVSSTVGVGSSFTLSLRRAEDNEAGAEA